MTGIGITQLGVKYGDNYVISGLDLEINDGEFFTLLGPSGCGKTTLLRTIAGFIEPAAGQINFGARNVTHIPTYKRNIGMVFQDYALFPDRSVFANVAYGLKARKVGKAETEKRVAEALDRVGMAKFADRLPTAISGGQRQRVALARALVIQPDVLLMDEPLSNLDTKLRIQIRDSITDLQKELGITTIFVTHDQEEALAMSDRIALLQDGSIAQLGSPTEIYQTPQSSYAASFIGSANVLPVEVQKGEPAQESSTLSFLLGDTSLMGKAATDISAGSAFLIARPEHLSLSTGEVATQQANSVKATVLRHQYLGKVRQYTVETGAGHRLEISESALGPEYASGAPVHVVFKAEHSLVVRS